MSQTIIPLQFEQYLQNKMSLGQPTDLNEFIFALIPDLDLSQPIDRDTSLPPMSQWVYQQDVDQIGKANSNALVYSVVIPSTEETFTFNAIFLRDKGNPNGLGMIVYKQTETKEPGMTLTKSMRMAFNGAAQSANITVPVQTWQIDYAARLAGMDEDVRLLARETLGDVILSGAQVSHVLGDDYTVTSGAVVVGGLRGELAQTNISAAGSKRLWLDAARTGAELDDQGVNITLVLADIDEVKTDYLDDAGHQHFVAALAEVNSGQVTMQLRPATASADDLRARTNKAFEKSITSEPAFKTQSNAVTTNCDLVVVVDGNTLAFPENTDVTLPDLVAGTDYAIYATEFELIASTNFTMPAGFTEDNSRRIGGFHMGAEGIKPKSIYDLKFRPKAPDPRGMVLTPAGFWADIYLLNTTPDLMGTSAFDVQIADGDSPPKIPAHWGGNGVSQYSNLTQYIAAEVLAAFGKRLPNHHEFTVLALGSVPGHASANDPVKTKHDANARSRCGCEQVSGHLWQWGSEVWDRGDGVNGYDWREVDTNGQGQIYAIANDGIGAARFGAGWDVSGFAGPRASLWADEPWGSSSGVGARGVCDHMELV